MGFPLFNDFVDECIIREIESNTTQIILHMLGSKGSYCVGILANKDQILYAHIGNDSNDQRDRRSSCNASTPNCFPSSKKGFTFKADRSSDKKARALFS